MSRHGDGGKLDDRRPASERDLYQRKFGDIDWTARAREQAMVDALVTGTGVLSIDPGARVDSNQVNAARIHKTLEEIEADMRAKGSL